MSAYDLRTRPPRRWTVEVDGVNWLPCLIDKARAYDAGTLGLYLYGQSPVDDRFLAAAGIDYDTLLNAVRAAPDDAGVLAEIERRAPGAKQRMRAWCAAAPPIRRILLAWTDVDEGYLRGPVARIVRVILILVAPAVTSTMRLVRPFKARAGVR